MRASMPPSVRDETAWSARQTPNTSLRPAARSPDQANLRLAAFLALTVRFLVTAFFAGAFAFLGAGFLRVLGRLLNAARCAAANADLAQPANASESSNSRAGNSQYEL